MLEAVDEEEQAVARQYSPKSFLRQAPNEMVRRYLDKRGVGQDIRWDVINEVDVEQIFAAIEAASDSVRNEIETDFREIEALADEGGISTLIEEGRLPRHGLDLVPIFEQMNGHLACSFWTFLEHPRVFEVAKRFDYADGLTFETRPYLPKVEMQPSEEAKEHLRVALSEYYRKEQGRGQGCHIDHYIRGDRHYYFCFLEDYAETRQVYQDHVLGTSKQKPAFDIIMVYDPAQRTLESKIKGGKQVRGDVERIFGRSMLGVDLGPPPDKGVVFDLCGLMSRDFEFALESDDGIEHVSLLRLKMRIMGREHRTVTIEVGAHSDDKAVWDLLDQLMCTDGIPKELLSPVQVKIRAVFIRKRGRSATRSFNITYPNRCTLKVDPRDEVLKQCLKRWKIDLSGRDDYSPPQPRLDAQYRLWRR